MDDLKLQVANNIRSLSDKVRAGAVQAVFCVALTDDGPTQVVYVEPEDRESLIVGINEEITRMLGSLHHIASAEKLAEFCALHKISTQDLLDFAAMQRKADKEGGNN